MHNCRPREPNNQDIYSYLQKIDANVNYILSTQHQLIAMIQTIIKNSDFIPSKRYLQPNLNSVVEVSASLPQREQPRPLQDICNYTMRSRSNHVQEYIDQPSQMMEDILFMHLNEVTEDYNLENSHQYIQEQPQQISTFSLQRMPSSASDLTRPQFILKSFKQEFLKMNLKFTQCEMVYTFPENNNAISMDKILDRQNVMLLMKLSSGQVISAFSEVPFSSKDVLIPRDNPRCFLCNFTQQHFLYASKTNKTHSVDRNYLMFGNWEIKIKMGDKILQSDVGKKGGCFMRDSFGGREIQVNTRQWLFGEESSKQKFQLQKYLIYVFK